MGFSLQYIFIVLWSKLDNVQVALNTFGRRLELELSRNQNLLPRLRPLSLFFADAGGDAVNYVEDNQVTSSAAQNLKGAQAWDIRDRVIYTERSHLGRWLEDWTKKNICVKC
jgi:hypothetical protein